MIESIAHRRPIAVGNYPVLDELRAFGVRAALGRRPGRRREPGSPTRGPEVLERNVERVRPHCSLDRPPRAARAAVRARQDGTRGDARDRIRSSSGGPASRAGSRWPSASATLLLLGAVVAFVVAAIAGFPSWAVTVTVVALVGACVVLPVPIVLGYGLRAAEREDRERRPPAVGCHRAARQ